MIFRWRALGTRNMLSVQAQIPRAPLYEADTHLQKVNLFSCMGAQFGNHSQAENTGRPQRTSRNECGSSPRLC